MKGDSSVTVTAFGKVIGPFTENRNSFRKGRSGERMSLVWLR